MKKVIFWTVLLSQSICAQAPGNLTYSIDFEKSLAFSGKLARANDLNLTKFMSMGEMRRKQIAQDYLAKHGITVQPPKMLKAPHCDQPHFASFDDYRLEIAMRYSSTVSQPVDQNGQFTALLLCQMLPAQVHQ